MEDRRRVRRSLGSAINGGVLLTMVLALVAGITFDRIPEGTNVRLFTVDGRPVKTLTTDADGKTTWDMTNNDGAPAPAECLWLAVTILI